MVWRRNLGGGERGGVPARLRRVLLHRHRKVRNHGHRPINPRPCRPRQGTEWLPLLLSTLLLRVVLHSQLWLRMATKRTNLKAKAIQATNIARRLLLLQILVILQMMTFRAKCQFNFESVSVENIHRLLVALIATPPLGNSKLCSRKLRMQRRWKSTYLLLVPYLSWQILISILLFQAKRYQNNRWPMTIAGLC